MIFYSHAFVCSLPETKIQNIKKCWTIYNIYIFQCSSRTAPTINIVESILTYTNNICISILGTNQIDQSLRIIST